MTADVPGVSSRAMEELQEALNVAGTEPDAAAGGDRKRQDGRRRRRKGHRGGRSVRRGKHAFAVKVREIEFRAAKERRPVDIVRLVSVLIENVRAPR